VSMSFPNETLEYRTARDALLASEIALRRQMEAVAAQLRALPPGGEVPEDYVFDVVGEGGSATAIRMSELFRGGDTLMMYHYMFPRHSADERAGPTAGELCSFGGLNLEGTAEVLSVSVASRLPVLVRIRGQTAT
jgi:predicted dithiol-disulfide oxidoreductase (DUF899 family)